MRLSVEHSLWQFPLLLRTFFRFIYMNGGAPIDNCPCRRDEAPATAPALRAAALLPMASWWPAVALLRNISDFGAVSDNRTVNTRAFQRAVAHCGCTRRHCRRTAAPPWASVSTRSTAACPIRPAQWPTFRTSHLIMSRQHPRSLRASLSAAIARTGCAAFRCADGGHKALCPPSAQRGHRSSERRLAVLECGRRDGAAHGDLAATRRQVRVYEQSDPLAGSN